MSHDILTIHDLAALIVQIEPNDLADLARVRRGLNAIAEPSPTLSQRPIAEAARRIDEMIEGKNPDLSGLFNDIGVFIEEATDAMEKSSGEETSLSSPEERERNGKPRSGTLLLKAYYSGGNVVVEISDNGRGLNRNKIMQKAIVKGLIESDKGISENEVIDLIFKPGFSTVDTVAEISGRGVGLDVVRKAVETLRNCIDVSSESDKGCTFSVRLPLTMAITDGMLVKVEQQKYILPTVNIDMSFHPDEEALSTIAGQGEVVVFKGKVLFIFPLHRLFNIVVAKYLGDGIGKVQGISSGVILGDGHVGLILDPQRIATLARQTSEPQVSLGEGLC